MLSEPMLEIAEISAWMQANPVLSGGIGTVAFGSAMYVARAVPRTILSALTRTFTTTFTITTRYRQYEEIALLLGQCSLPFLMRNFAPNDAARGDKRRRGRPTSMPSNLAPGYGKGWARYGRHLLTFDRSMMENKGEVINEEITVRFLTRDVRVVERFLREAETLQDAEQVKIYISDGSYFSGPHRKPQRRLDSVFVASSVKARLVESLRRFQESEETYALRGIPYKFCAVLHGQPGTGKTSLVHAIASRFDLNINYVTSLAQIDSLVSECGVDDLLVIEDIDALAADLHRGKGKDDEEEGPELKVIPTSTLHKLLNGLDGFCTPHGLKVLITTNHPDRLDPALLRAGRTDLLLEVGPIAGDDLRAMFEAFYGAGSASLLEDRTIAPHTGSRLQQIFVAHTAEEARDILLGDLTAVELECKGTSEEMLAA